MKEDLTYIVREAGSIILNFYGDKLFDTKEDNSPLTKADKASHNFLTHSLRQIKDIPILSEEDIANFDVRKNWSKFWLIDPLDGTKEYINQQDDFCINIALMIANKPTLGVIYAPVLNELYLADEKGKFDYFGQKRPVRTDNDTIVAISRFHHSPRTKEFLEINNLLKTSSIGAAIKFGRMALGEIDLYPRLQGSKEWDIAAGHLIISAKNFDILDLKTNTHPIYNKQNLSNNEFIAYKADLNINHLKWPNFS